MTQNENKQRNRELSWIVAAVLGVGLVSFLAGYFMGMRHGVRSFVIAQQEELAAAVIDDTETHVFTDALPAGEVSVPAQTPSVPIPPVSTPLARRYWALVTTVDHYTLATELMQNAAHAGVVIHIKKASQQLPKGKKKTVYRLVTPRYADQHELELTLEKLKKVPVLARYMRVDAPSITDDKNNESKDNESKSNE